jgi:hypothetical protein
MESELIGYSAFKLHPPRKDQDAVERVEAQAGGCALDDHDRAGFTDGVITTKPGAERAGRKPQSRQVPLPAGIAVQLRNAIKRIPLGISDQSIRFQAEPSLNQVELSRLLT